MTERRRIQGDPTLGFAPNGLEGERCIECGAPATMAVEGINGLVHYCNEHIPCQNCGEEWSE